MPNDSTGPEFDVRIISTPDAIVELAAAGSEDTYQVTERQEAKDESTQEFGLAEVLVAITIINGLNGLRKLAQEIYEKIRDRNYVVYRIQGPARTVTVRHSPELSEEEVRKLVDVAVGMSKQ